MECSGKKYVKRWDHELGRNKLVAEPVDGRVVVDAHAFYHCQNRATPALDRSLSGEMETESESESESEPESESESEPRKSHRVSTERNEDLKSMTEVECIMALPRVRGFDLRDKIWCEFNLDDLRAPIWSKSPYDNLVIPSGAKELLITFAESSRIRLAGFDDFVKNKGKGIIFLLCGPPDVGKTLSAEAVAEKTKAPLYNLSAGDLGTDPGKLEKALTDALKCCQLWGAVLLLDEADVFLEARGIDNLQRNELVSIFLRHLEYYQGLMFLTTNRASTIDPALKSRVDLILAYSPLDREARQSIWVNFIQRLPKGDVELQNHEILELASSRMNGREIKSTLKTAWILAANDKPLRMQHFKIVLDNRRLTENLDLSSGEYLANKVPSKVVHGRARLNSS
ncbi:hypothetical protein DL771_003371 [Monosporascus sp. 5C6A]|nr:hypothetical protein DL771_003371 [Monosporascus sp. 5C6A]